MFRHDASRRTDSVAEKLRQRILAMPADALIGSEDALVEETQTSRSTLRQVARMLEGEGLLKVKRGVGGGYYSARPDLATIQTAVSSYLQTVAVKPTDPMTIASVLWREAIRQAADADPRGVAALSERFRPAVARIAANATYAIVLECERAFREAVFSLIDSAYIRLIFQINSTMAAAYYRPGSESDASPEHATFVGEWRSARLLEIGALETGDAELACSAAQHMRLIWNRRVALSLRTSR